MANRRLNPRRATDLVVVHTADPSSGWSLPSQSVVPLSRRVQASAQARTVLIDERPHSAAYLVLLAPAGPGQSPAEAVVQWPLGSSMTCIGLTAYVETVLPILNRGRLVAVKVTAGPLAPGFAGGWVVEVTVRRRIRDRRGDFGPVSTLVIPAAVIQAVSSREDVDLADTAESKAVLTVPPGSDLRSTDSIDVSGSPLAGRWLVDGDPTPTPTGVEAQLVRRL